MVDAAAGGVDPAPRDAVEQDGGRGDQVGDEVDGDGEPGEGAGLGGGAGEAVEEEGGGGGGGRGYASIVVEIGVVGVRSGDGRGEGGGDDLGGRSGRGEPVARGELGEDQVKDERVGDEGAGSHDGFGFLAYKRRVVVSESARSRGCKKGYLYQEVSCSGHFLLIGPRN